MIGNDGEKGIVTCHYSPLAFIALIGGWAYYNTKGHDFQSIDCLESERFETRGNDTVWTGSHFERASSEG